MVINMEKLVFKVLGGEEVSLSLKPEVREDFSAEIRYVAELRDKVYEGRFIYETEKDMWRIEKGTELYKDFKALAERKGQKLKLGDILIDLKSRGLSDKAKELIQEAKEELGRLLDDKLSNFEPIVLEYRQRDIDGLPIDEWWLKNREIVENIAKAVKGKGELYNLWSALRNTSYVGLGINVAWEKTLERFIFYRTAEPVEREYKTDWGKVVKLTDYRAVLTPEVLKEILLLQNLSPTEIKALEEAREYLMQKQKSVIQDLFVNKVYYTEDLYFAKEDDPNAYSAEYIVPPYHKHFEDEEPDLLIRSKKTGKVYSYWRATEERLDRLAKLESQVLSDKITQYQSMIERIENLLKPS